MEYNLSNERGMTMSLMFLISIVAVIAVVIAVVALLISGGGK